MVNYSYLHDEYRDLEIAYGMAERQLKETKAKQEKLKVQEDLARLSNALDENRKARGFK